MCLLAAISPHAQEDKVEVFGGYSYLHFHANPSTNLNKDQATYRQREKLFSSIAKSQSLPLGWSLRGNPGMMLDQRADLFESLTTSVYNDYTDLDENVRIVRFQAVY